MSRYSVWLLLGVVGWSAWSLPPTPAADKAPGEKSALEREPEGWVDLLPGKDLAGWKRLPLPPDEKLGAKNPWSVDAANKTLLCDGVGIKEMLLHDRERADGTFHVEWRFRKVEGKKDYNSGIYVRTAADGQVWHQAQVAHLPGPPRMADLFGDTLVDGKRKRVIVSGQGSKLARPPGAWNTCEITGKGKTLSVWLNGAVATTWDDCQVPKGHLGLQAEYFFIEFRNLKFRSLDPNPGGK